MRRPRWWWGWLFLAAGLAVALRVAVVAVGIRAALTDYARRALAAEPAAEADWSTTEMNWTLFPKHRYGRFEVYLFVPYRHTDGTPGGRMAVGAGYSFLSLVAPVDFEYCFEIWP